MGGLPEGRRTPPAGVDIERFAVERDGSDVRRRHGLKPEDLVLFYMGWVYPFSGISEVAKGLLSDAGREPALKLVVLGKGDAWASLEFLAGERSEGGRIKLIDFQPYAEVPSY